MKKIYCLIILVLSTAQAQVPYEKLEAASRLIEEIQLESQGAKYSWWNQIDAEVSFPPRNFNVAFHNQLATYAMYKKLKEGEFLFLDNQLDLSKATGFDSYESKGLRITSIYFPENSIKKDIYRDGELVGTSEDNYIEFFEKLVTFNRNDPVSPSRVLPVLIDLIYALKKEKGLITDEQIEKEKSDWNKLSKEQFLAKYPNSIFARQASADIAIAKRRSEELEEAKLKSAIKHLDEMAKLIKTKLDMTTAEFMANYPLAEKVMKNKKNVFTLPNCRQCIGYNVRNAYPELETLLFQNDRLVAVRYEKSYGTESEMMAEYNKYLREAKANIEAKYITHDRSDTIIFKMPGGTSSYTYSLSNNTDRDRGGPTFSIEFMYDWWLR